MTELMQKVQTELMQKVQEATWRIEDQNRRRHARKVLDGFAGIKTEVVRVGEARQMLSPLRERVHAGCAALIADRGVVQNPEETTVMIALSTFQQLIFDLIHETAKASVVRQPAADMLAGLSRAPLSVADLEVDTSAIESGHPDQAISGIEL